jgi:hypothetical protein
MKLLPALAALLLAIPHLGQATTWDTLPVTPGDVAQILELKPSDYRITKTQLTFDGPKKVTLRHTSGSTTRDLTLPGVSPSVTLLTYIPKEGGNVKPLNFWVTGSGGGTSSSFAIDTTKVKFTQSEIIDGVFTIRGAIDKDVSHPEYEIQILTSDP